MSLGAKILTCMASVLALFVGMGTYSITKIDEMSNNSIQMHDQNFTNTRFITTVSQLLSDIYVHQKNHIAQVEESYTGQYLKRILSAAS